MAWAVVSGALVFQCWGSYSNPRISTELKHLDTFPAGSGHFDLAVIDVMRMNPGTNLSMPTYDFAWSTEGWAGDIGNLDGFGSKSVTRQARANNIT